MVLALFLTLATLTACSNRPSIVGPLRPGQFDCGDYRFTESRLGDGSQCILDKMTAGVPARLVVRAHTTEGDPILDMYEVTGPRALDWWHDARADKFGSRRVEHHTCSAADINSGRLYPIGC